MYICVEGPLSWNLNSFYLAVLFLSPCFTEAYIYLTFGAVAPWCRIVRKKASLFLTHGFLLLTLQGKGNFCQTSRLFFTVCNLQWEKTVWLDSPGLRRKTCTQSLEGCLFTAGEHQLPDSGLKSCPFYERPGPGGTGHLPTVTWMI